MMPQAELFARAYVKVLAEFAEAFPNVQPSEIFWFEGWVRKYGFRNLSNVIKHLAVHPLKAQFTTESTGKAISALLRENAMKQAIAEATKPGAVRHE
jgi:hypothetical protein